ncbi:DUF3304 domain-containing protein [Variovorax humicola]|uniref:DUF3304 domain-containing protein n=1 Tax=Variovorax humicola TaxID=1769758 RepID=A0ABU8VY92_9BURK
MPVEPMTSAVSGLQRLPRTPMNHLSAVLRRLAALAVAGWVLTGCQSVASTASPSQPQKAKSFASGITGYNFTNEGVQYYVVDGNYGSNLPPYGGGGATSCCVRVPSQWQSDLTVKVDWVIGHYTQPWEKRKHMTLEEETACCWTQRTLSKTVPIERYEKGGALQVFFLPGDEIKVYVSNMDLGHKDHPSGMAYPERPAAKP